MLWPKKTPSGKCNPSLREEVREDQPAIPVAEVILLEIAGFGSLPGDYPCRTALERGRRDLA
jgi:hypothetical protein